MNFLQIEKLALKYGAELLFDEKLAPYTTFKIGGECSAMLKANCAEVICEALYVCNKEKLPYFILGKGSNVLTEKFNGLIILISSDFSGITRCKNVIHCLAGTSLVTVCKAALEGSLTGMEFAYGIPGTVGGALFMNAGAYGGEMSQIVLSCTCTDENGNVITLEKDEMELSYRSSVFEKRGLVILTVDVKLEDGDKTEISKQMNTLMEKRRASQPLEYPSAGSTFKRPVGRFAAQLIEASGLKGFSCGGAEVSTKHSGFVINKNGASFDDVMNVITGVKKTVLEDSGIMLECEVRILK